MTIDSKLKREYDEFMARTEVPPAAISEQLISVIHHELNPSIWRVLAKLSLIHLFSAVVTLSICPQFGVRIFGQGMGLMVYFMRLGDQVCAAACGAFFTMFSLFVAGIVLRSEEVRAIARHRGAEILALTGLSLGFFIMLRADIVIEFALVWFGGAVLGGLSGLGLGWLFRRKAMNFT